MTDSGKNPQLEGIPVDEVDKQYPEIIEAVEQALDGEEVRVNRRSMTSSSRRGIGRCSTMTAF